MGNDETIRLILETTGTASLQEAASKVVALKDSYEVLERKVGEYALADDRAMDEVVQSAVEATQAHRALNQVLDETAVSTQAVTVSAAGLGQTSGHSGDFGRGILQGSFAIQDFTSQLGTRGLLGGLAAVQNNIPLILTSFGAGAGLAGVISVVSVGLGVLIDQWPKLSEAWSGEKLKLPELKEGLEGIKDTLKDVDEQIEKLEKQAKDGGLNLFDEQKLKKLRGLKAEGEQRQADEKLVGSIGELDSKSAREVAAAVKAAIAEFGGGQAVAHNLVMNTELDRTQATAVVAGAMRGNTSDLDTLLKGVGGFAQTYAPLSPEGRAKHKADQESLKREQKFQEDRLKEIAAREKNQETLEQLEQEDADKTTARNEHIVQDKRHKAEREHHKREQDERRAAHDADPLVQAAKARQEEERQVRNAVNDLNRQTGGTASQGFIDQVVREALGNVDAGQVIGYAINNAVNAVNQKIKMDALRQMQRNEQFSNTRLWPQ